MGNFATDKLGAGTILWSATERPIVAPNGTLYWDVTDEHFYIRKFDAWVVLSEGGSTGTIGGSIALNQIAVGSGANTIAGFADFTWVNSTNTLQIGTAPFIQMSPTLIGGNSAIVFSTGLFGTGSQIVAGPGNGIFQSISTNQFWTVSTNAGTDSLSYSAATGYLSFVGGTSGSAAIGVALVAGTPNPILLPTTTGTVGQALITDGNNPQQTSWATFAGLNSPAFTGTPTAPTAALGTNTTQLATTAFVIANSPREIASGTATLPTGALPANTSSAATTVAGAGILATDAIEWAFNAAPGTGYTEGVFVAAYVTAGNVNFIQTNPTAGSRTPAAATLNWRVIR